MSRGWNTPNLSVVEIKFALQKGWPIAVKHLIYRLTSDRVGIPAELKHINKRRKRNQQGSP